MCFNYINKHLKTYIYIYPENIVVSDFPANSETKSITCFMSLNMLNPLIQKLLKWGNDFLPTCKALWYIKTEVPVSLATDFAALSRTSTLQILPPKMVQLCIQILYAWMAIYKILKPPSLISLVIFMFPKCVNSSKPWRWRYLYY